MDVLSNRERLTANVILDDIHTKKWYLLSIFNFLFAIEVTKEK